VEELSNRQPYAIVCAIDQSVFYQTINQFLEPGQVFRAKFRFDFRSESMQGNALVGGS
jgi:hypothetical protein